MTSSIADPTGIRNWQRRPDGITTSGKLEASDAERLAAIGVKHVVNLALDDHPEALENEAEILAQAGIAYKHIPVPFNSPSIEHYRQLRDAIEQLDGPVHIHCIMNYRVTAFLYLMDIASGVPQEEAHARMAKVWDPLNSDESMAQPWKELLNP